MTKKHQDVLGSTYFPEELTAMPTGSNFGIGEFQFDNSAGSMSARFDAGGGSGLPEGLDGAITASLGRAIDLGDIMRESSIQDLSWLEVSEQDLDRLPKNPFFEAVPELEEAWGMNRRTDGVNLQANNLDLDRIRYEESLKEANDKPRWKHDSADLARVIRRAMRRSAAGVNLDAILKEAAEALGDEAVRIRPAMLKVKDEHGLAGNVFIRAAAYPGYTQGKWKDEIRKSASNAKFIIVTPREMKLSTTIQNGWCMVTGKRAVTEVPWNAALAHYGPILRAAGHKVAGSDPKAALRAAFLSAPKALDKVAEFKPTHIAPADRISSADALSEVQSFNGERQVVTAAHADRRRKKAAAQIGKWVSNGLLAKDKALSLIRDYGEDPYKLVQAALAVVKAGKEAAAYSGVENDTRMEASSIEEARIALASVEDPKVPMHPETRGVLRWARKAMSEGAAGQELDWLIERRFAPSTIKRAQEALDELRAAHEGGAGFAYVDAKGYASKSGTTGCDEGALKHRANQIKNVLAMDRCAGCAFRAERKDGTSKCQKYAKSLITPADFPAGMRNYRQAMIRQANLGDAEATNELFSRPGYDPTEFNLTASEMNDFEIEPEHNTERIAEILFGGMIVETK